MRAIVFNAAKSSANKFYKFWISSLKRNVYIVHKSCSYSTVVFDRWCKTEQRNRTARYNEGTYDYIKDEVGWRIADRVFDIKREFGCVLDVGCGKGHVLRHLDSKCTKNVIAIDNANLLLDMASSPNGVNLAKRCVDDESFLLEDNSIDLVISSLTLHWINDLSGFFNRVIRVLKEDSPFIGACYGSSTLHQLRSTLQLAAMERLGGVRVNVSPLLRPDDISILLDNAGFALLTVDVDIINVGYPGLMDLMLDLQGMGESNACVARSQNLGKDCILAASSLYNTLYGYSDDTNGTNSITATFDIIYFIGWKPGPNQAKPLPRGCAQISLKDLQKFTES